MFNVTVATAPSKGLDMERDKNLLKTGLLYGDKTKMYSMSFPISFCRVLQDTLFNNGNDDNMKMFLRSGNNAKMLLEFLSVLFPQKANRINKSSGISLFDEAEKLFAQTEKEGYENIDIDSVRKAIDKVQKQFDATMHPILSVINNSRIMEILPALQEGLIDVDDYETWTNDLKGKDAEENFIDRIINDTITGASHPMYDDDLSILLSQGIRNDKYALSDVKQRQIKHISTVHHLFMELPNFRNADISEIVDIRKDLDQYLIPFRYAMKEFSEKIKYLPWDNEFEQSIAECYIDLEYNIHQIINVTKQKSYLSKLCTNIFTDKKAIGTIARGVAIGIAPVPTAINIGAILTGGASLFRVAKKTFDEHRDEKNTKENNVLFFYHKLKDIR